MSTAYGAVRFISNGAGKTGLTPSVTIYEVSKATAAATIVDSTSGVEIGGGLYGVSYASADLDTYFYIARFVTADTAVTETDPCVWLTDATYVGADMGIISTADPLLNTVPGAYTSGTAGYALGRIGTGRISTVSPVAQSGDIELVKGDDYNNTDGRALSWTEDDTDAWPDLTSATVTFYLGDLSKPLTVVTPTGTKQVRLELTREETSRLPKSDKAYFSVRAQPATTTRQITLVRGSASIEDAN